jgi:hypothetical protein
MQLLSCGVKKGAQNFVVKCLAIYLFLTFSNLFIFHYLLCVVNFRNKLFDHAGKHFSRGKQNA